MERLGGVYVALEICGIKKSCMCGQYADANPRGTTWLVTKKGFELHKEWGLERVQRDQDSFRMHTSNDWSGYGTCEVIKDMVRTTIIYHNAAT